MQRTECLRRGLHVHHPLSRRVRADPETKRVLAVALQMTRVSLGLTDDLADGIIAKHIVELARTGERQPDVLCEGVLKTLRGTCSETKQGSSKRFGSAGFQVGQPARFGAVFGRHSRDPRRDDARGRDGGVREKLAAGVSAA